MCDKCGGDVVGGEIEGDEVGIDEVEGGEDVCGDRGSNIDADVKDIFTLSVAIVGVVDNTSEIGESFGALQDPESPQ